jgi:hypothetical protein
MTTTPDDHTVSERLRNHNDPPGLPPRCLWVSTPTRPSPGNLQTQRCRSGGA